MNKYLNKKVAVYEKVYDVLSSVNKKVTWNYNVTEGVVTGFIDNKFIELDNKMLLSLDYIYKIEIID